MGALQFTTDHVIFKLCYNQIYQMKTTMSYEFTNFAKHIKPKIRLIKLVKSQTI